jgi:hypothetical protein
VAVGVSVGGTAVTVACGGERAEVVGTAVRLMSVVELEDSETGALGSRLSSPQHNSSITNGIRI